MRVISSADCTKLPWKNGLGVSKVIASDPPVAGHDAVDWQVGMTEFGADCPFSSLPGMDRQFMLLSGGGVELHCVDLIEGIDLRRALDAPFVPFAFRGDWQTTCRMLGEPVKVLNVMTRRGRVAAKISLPRWTGQLFCEQKPGETVIAVLLGGAAQVVGRQVPLALHESVILDRPDGDRCAIVASGTAARMAVVHIAPPAKG